MKKLIKPSNINGRIKIPSSKSMMQRAVACSIFNESLHQSHSPLLIKNASFCKDSLAALDIVKTLGFNVEISDYKVLISGNLKTESNLLNCNESGLCMRMFTPIASIFSDEMVLTGNDALLKRPVDMIEKPLKSLGVSCQTTHGFPPVTVKGPLLGGKAEVDGSVSSQFLTGLLLALPVAKNDSELFVKDLKSLPYIDMTIDVMKKFGVNVENDNYKRFFISGNQKYKRCVYGTNDIYIEGDWSNASFFLVAGAISGQIYIEDLSQNSFQADKNIIQCLRKCGAEVEIGENFVRVSKKNLNSFEFDATNCPDLFPPIVALAVNCNGISVVKGVNRLKYKESNRGESLKQEFEKIGAKIQIDDDIMRISSDGITGGKVMAHNDHRIAMALAICGLISKNGIEIDDSKCVSKSYPDFFDHLDSIII